MRVLLYVLAGIGVVGLVAVVFVVAVNAAANRGWNPFK